MKKVRDYYKLLNEIINRHMEFQIEILGCVSYEQRIYPMIVLKRISKANTRNVVITAGQHGPEYYATNILLRWITQPIMCSQFNYYIFPCINMFGYEYNCRENGNKQDTNNAINFIKDSKVPELALLYDSFPQSVNLIIDIHGDVDKDACYFYEHKLSNLPSIAEKTALECNQVLPYLKQKTIYGSKLINGVLMPPKEDIGIEEAAEKMGAEYTITFELPGKFEGQKRAEGGIAVINSLLYNFNEVKL